MSTNKNAIYDIPMQNLKYLRVSLDLNQGEMGKKIGMGQAGYSDIENGKNKMKDKFLINVSNAFGVSLNWLLLNEGPMLLKDISTGGVEEDRAIMWLKDHDEKLQAIGSGIRGMLERIDALERRLSGPG